MAVAESGGRIIEKARHASADSSRRSGYIDGYVAQQRLDPTAALPRSS